MKKEMQDPRYEQEILIDTPKRAKGRPEYGRRLEDDKKNFQDNKRKSRSIWGTVSEIGYLKEVLEIMKYNDNYEKITLGEIMKAFLHDNPTTKLTEGERNPMYQQKY